MKKFLTTIQQFMSYSGAQGNTDNPTLKHFDWVRRIYNLSVEKPLSETKTIPPSQTMELFFGYRVITPTTGDIFKIAFLDEDSSTYRLINTSGTSSFRTARTLTGVSDCTITINNGTLAIFDFGSATHTAQIGDILRIKGYNTGDATTPWNPMNTGNWVIIGISGSKFQCVRPTGEQFVAIAETATAISSAVEIFSSAGVQAGDKMLIDGILMLSLKTYAVKDVTPTAIDFVSAEAIPVEIESPYVANSIQFPFEGKKFIYIETDQEISVRFNGDTGDSNLVVPEKAGEQAYVGTFQKTGPMYQCVIKNRSLNPAQIMVLTAE